MSGVRWMSLLLLVWLCGEQMTPADCIAQCHACKCERVYGVGLVCVGSNPRG